MESEYDQKFEDMKKYIPFLESMIKRLESTNALSSNPRQAQLDKIKSLRDLLLDKKKRMKMENLLKCEQVLVNLYAKVEQKDTLPIRSSGPSGNDSFKMDNNLEIVRNKLKRVSKIQDEAGTLPEIVRASDIEDVCTAGSVEPALFQRRPHKKSPTLSDISPSPQEKINSPETTSARKYTRVLMSPERNSRVRSSSHDSIDGALFSRRSPRKSPKRSSSHIKKESKKSSSSKVSPGKTKDLNITLNVPEESLNSLNTKDIVSRIITCNDNDVDIDTLRGLRTQILSELKQTGANDDISDLILKSYTEKKTTPKKKEDIEEGELSDSESEAIENIYGSLVLVDKDKTKTEEKPFLEKNQPRKIQICLVINSKDKSEQSSKEIIVSDPKTNEETDLEMFNNTKESIRPESKIEENQKLVKQASTTSELKNPPDSDEAIVDDSFDTQESSQEKLSKTTEDHIAGENFNTSDKVTDEKVITINKEIINAEEPTLSKNIDKNSMIPFKANFYKPLQEEESSAVSKNTYFEKRDKCSDIKKQDLSSIFDKKDGSVEIPLLNEPIIHDNPVEKDIDSQIDILQALKNEILADNILPVPNLDVITPPLHQPKLSKVAGVQSISTKKRISIEKYKEKTAPATLTSALSNDVISSPLREDNNKKQSLKLTEKECERFNFPAKLNIHDDMSSEDETHKDLNFAPKSPDDDTRFVAKTQPVIIPVDPVKTPVINTKADVDMRTMATLPPKISPVINNTTTFDKTEEFKNDAKNENSSDFADKISTLLDPRTRKDISQPLNWDGNNLAVIKFDEFSKSTPSSNKVFNTKLTPSMTPNAMSFDLTGNHQNPDIELKESHKHAFAPSFPFESKDSSTSDEFCSTRNSERDAGFRKSRWGEHDQDFRNNTNSQRSKYGEPYKRDADIEKKSRTPSDNKNDEPVRTHGPLTPLPLFGWAETPGAIDQFGRLDTPIATLMNLGRQDCSNTSTHPFGNSDGPPTLSQTFNRSDMPLTPSHPFGRTDRPMTPNHTFGRTDCPPTPIHPFGRSDCPPTPSHSFGRGECPATPIHPFGRSDCPATPSHPFGRSDIPPMSNSIFGRSDCPATPSHPFGRSDCPATPSHPFGRSDCPATPSHPFGRSDCPATPSHPFGRSDCPATPSHPFGRSDCPATPSHPFGRIDAPPTPNNPFMRFDFPGPSHQYGMPDCPATPSHPFSRLDCPQTPSHPFGMSECPKTPSHPFGRVETAVTPNYSFNRTDHSQSIPLNKQFSKDPRLNRRSEYEARRRRDERNHENYNDRGFNAGGFYRKQSQGYGKSESYVNRDKKINDSRRSTSISYSERSMAHEMLRDYDKEKSGNTERGNIYKYHNRSKRRDRESDERYYRGKSSERSNDSYENARSQSRDDSLTRNNKKEICNENKLSFKGDAGRSFTIDTSVNSTFQDLLKKKGLEIRDTSLDARKDRAGSVGRSRVKSFIDSSDESAIAGDSNNRNKNYKRASSVGRDLYSDKDSRSYQEVKTDFQCYKSNLRITGKDDGNLCDSKAITCEEIQKNKKLKDDVNTNPVANKQTYSPRKNYRDPRMRRDYDERNKYGISYSSDSIAKGTILGSGYGVKNYKIPKIKRPHNDITSKDTVNNEVSECDDTKLENCESKTLKDPHKKEVSGESKDMSSDIPSKRITRSAKKQDEVKSLTSSKDGRMKTRRKKFVYDSSSDEDIVNKESVDNNFSSDDEKASSKYCESNTNKKNKKETKPQPGTNDIEIFSDNLSDPVTDNISALIDNLDNHIDNFRRDSVKNTDENESSNMDMNATASLLIKEDKLEVLKNDFNIDDAKQSKHSDIQEKDLIKEKIDSLTATSFEPNLEKSHEKSAKVSHEEKYLDRNKEHDVDFKTPVINAEICSQPISASGKDTNNESLVSTTGRGSIHEEMAGSTVESVEGNVATSPADSTNEITQAKPNEHAAPDSTNEVHNEMNSDVSSSLTTSEVSKDFVESGSSRLETIAPLNSIGSLLSMLQDKSKIHQLLSMLDDQTGDNDKIKRKLEKLSEIVSDDEEELANNKDNTDHNITNKDTTSNLSKNNGDVEVGDVKVLNTEVTDSAQNKHVEDNNVKEDKEQNIEKKDTETILNEAREINAPKKGKGLKKGKGKNSKASKAPRVTRAAVAQTENPPTVKKLSRELIKLREDIKEMFLTDEMLNSTGIRMCRLAKLVDEKSVNRKEDITQPNPKPVVVLEKYKNHNKSVETTAEAEKPIKKKPSPKSKRNVSGNSETSDDSKTVNFKPKPVTKNISMSKTKVNVASKQQEVDPYEFETDSVDTNAQKDSESEEDSDTETNSLASSLSFGSSELLADLQKKTKRKRRGNAWQAGIIEPKNKKKKQTKKTEPILPDDPLNTERNIVIPDKECFTDKYYCFQKNVSSYSCRLCVYTGDDIILHYKQQHPHTEIPLSRMNPDTAKEAIEQCQEVNFPAISKISTNRYVCRFCFKEFCKAKTLLESFFWHIVSMHTGEYKQTCFECDPQPCFFYLDIPSPPKDNKGQLIGYLCGKCNFTQVSLENLKTHVIGRHNDEQTDVYTINLSAMSRKTLKSLAIRNETPAPRVLRSSLSNRSASDNVDDNSEISEQATVNKSMPLKEEPDLASTKEKEEITSIQSKIAFESDGNITVPTMTRNGSDNSIDIKQESFETEIDEPSNIEDSGEQTVPDTSEMELEPNIGETQQGMPDDILDYPHFKICYKESGIKEYVCCINGKDNHYKTSLLISMKKHVQSKHEENWDGYCTMCKVIVKPPGTHSFKDCLQHFIDRHMDEFPVLETVTEVFNEDPPVNVSCDVSVEEPKYINVRPLDQLIFSANQDKNVNDNSMTVPIIESVVSLNSSVTLPQPSPNYASALGNENQEIKQYKYEEWQAEVMSKKHRVVLNAMMTQEKLIKIYKCTGRFCSFTTDNAEHALLHATTHQRIGGEGAMYCAYCDFDACNNGIDLVMHVFKAHGNCQYACGLCFYRALASQLVRSHMNRKHPNIQPSQSVLNTATDTKPVTDDSDNILSREVAVPHYMCEQSSLEVDGGPCKFRTYTPTQFCEHLQQRHQAPYPCNMCPNVMSNASEMVNHMKEHGYRLYQCTCCVFGADNENDMLDHASICHPMRLPQAYLRVITNTGGQQLKVLPRVYLNKCKVATKHVASDVMDDPVREAERCIELEKLIGNTETVNQVNVASSSRVPLDTVSDSGVLLQDEPFIDSSEQGIDDPNYIPDMVTNEMDKKSVEQNENRVFKTEPNETPSTKPDEVVYCLDSDEEDPMQRVIDLSDEDLITTPTAETTTIEKKVVYKKIPLSSLFLCPGCKNVYRNCRTLKKHFYTCFPTAPVGELKCPHEECTKTIIGSNGLIHHYNRDHTYTTIYLCGVCNSKFKAAASVKQHMKVLHKLSQFAPNPVSTVVDGNATVVIHPAVSARKTLPTRKRYGPQDIDRLPINPILDSLVYCSLCEFNTKVRLNMVRHLQLHAHQQPAPQTAPVNPVPHLETNERHFDKMLNLASSSIANRPPPEKQIRPEKADLVALVPAENASRYPTFVPDRQRFTCGAKGCAYISVDEAMFRCHWDTLHANINDYHCVHCPSYQHLDTTRPLTSARIIAHLNMHEGNLFACSACSFYHYKRNAVEKHSSTTHTDAQVLIVRQEGLSATVSVPLTPVISPPSSAPTMDLKPWQCGLCKFKSMLRPEVAEHCTKVHQSKMQYKCNYCPFRTSTVENVTKHQSKSHPDKSESVFYYYYREGSIPDEDGTPKWVKQSQKIESSEPVVKSEVPEPSTFGIGPTPVIPVPVIPVPVTPAPVAVDLKLVKQEVEELAVITELELSPEDLCKKFGDFCEPVGLNYKCPLCAGVVEETAEAMRSHLFEELKYRKWGCTLCSYKAFHKDGLNAHITSEHRRKNVDHIELETNVNIEKWVTQLLEYQTSIIEKNKISPIFEEIPSTSKQVADKSDSELYMEQVELAFGPFGSPRDGMFCCPKCDITIEDERTMKEHLESELAKIRWGCSNCSFKSANYHETQFHCKTAHPNFSAKPLEAVRQPRLRAGWVHIVIYKQKQMMKSLNPQLASPEKNTFSPDPQENSLLVVRYEERVPTPETTVKRKRSASDSNEEKLVIDESKPTKKKSIDRQCQYCGFKTKWPSTMREHTLRHFNLKPFRCAYCDLQGHRYVLAAHIAKQHPGKLFKMELTPVPIGPPIYTILPRNMGRKSTEILPPQICLYCEKSLPESEIPYHIHENFIPEFAKKGEVVVKCGICSMLRLDVASLQEHHNASHADVPLNYLFVKLQCDLGDNFICGHCSSNFSDIKVYKAHHRLMHSTLHMKFVTALPTPVREECPNLKRKHEDSTSEQSPKRVAKKSTTKLPFASAVAKKSTTKLPFGVGDEVEDEIEYSVYGTKSTPLTEYANISTLVNFHNTMVPFTVKKLRTILNIEPIVQVKDIRK